MGGQENFCDKISFNRLIMVQLVMNHCVTSTYEELPLPLPGNWQFRGRLPTTSFIGWNTGNSGASVPNQKMASLVEAIHFKLSGMMST